MESGAEAMLWAAASAKRGRDKAGEGLKGQGNDEKGIERGQSRNNLISLSTALDYGHHDKCGYIQPSFILICRDPFSPPPSEAAVHTVVAYAVSHVRIRWIAGRYHTHLRKFKLGPANGFSISERNVRQQRRMSSYG